MVQGHEPRRGVSQHCEVGCGWGAHGQRATLRVNLIVHQTPLLQEGVDPGESQVFTILSLYPLVKWFPVHLNKYQGLVQFSQWLRRFVFLPNTISQLL